MKCIYCGGKTSVINSRRQQRNNNIWRRRQCENCLAVFTSIESADLASSLSVNRSGQYSPFLTDLLFTDILMAISHRKDCYRAARELTNSIISNLTKAKSADFTPAQISQETAKVLKRFDKRAYLHYLAEHASLTS